MVTDGSSVVEHFHAVRLTAIIYHGNVDCAVDCDNRCNQILEIVKACCIARDTYNYTTLHGLSMCYLKYRTPHLTLRVSTVLPTFITNRN